MRKETGKRGRTSRRTEMVAAAASLLQEHGLQGVTTRAIAEAVPCSEGAIYVHFRDRLELILEILRQSLPEMLVPLHALQEQVGTRTPEENLIQAVGGLMRFHDRVAPMLCSLITDRELLQRFRQSLKESGKGPDRGIATIAAYIDRETELGRIHPDVEAKTAASVLMASSFFHIFTTRLFGPGRRLDVKALVQFALRSSSADRGRARTRRREGPRSSGREASRAKPPC